MRKFLTPAILSLPLFLTGCMTPIGQEEFTCNAETQGGYCGGPRDIYEITNNATSVQEYISRRDENVRVQTPQTGRPGHNGSATGNRFSNRDNTVTYIPRSHEQQTKNNYQPAEVYPVVDFPEAPNDEFINWPGYGEPLAPEPLAVLEAPQVMRVLVAPWSDDSGNLNLSSYVYVEVTPRRWSYGEAANKRPSRVVPFDIRQQSQEEMRRQHQRSQGVNPLEVMTPGARGN